ncbi:MULTISPECIES: hypothetical protein [Micromonospora]|uniref:hypothetical protein n=1 Tax=Micromonospora TaxID=1873 RepID=UPI0006B04648|nr:hypothetical protein [Micromonospora sp. NRRL B-16802]KOX05725.1 hypothetical protein ADK66_25155 [Micromonospora sp. NRRL B-16802]
MRDDMTFVERVHRDLNDVRWAEPQEIRARARRRSRRTATLAAVAVLAALTGPAYALTARTTTPAETAVPIPSGTIASAGDIPQESLLTPSEVPVVTGVQLGDAGLGEVVRLDPMLQRCGDDRGVPEVRAYSRYSRSQTLLSPTTDGGGPVRAELSQDVYRLDPAESGQLFAQLRALLDACRKWHYAGSITVDGETMPAEIAHSWETAASNFAGDESILMRHVPSAPLGPPAGRKLRPGGRVDTTLVLRVGDLVTVLVPGINLSLSDTDLKALGRAAAQRMCGAAVPSC